MNSVLVDRLERLEQMNLQLAQRLQATERAHQRLKRAGGLTLLGLVLLVIAGAKLADDAAIVEAQRFVLKGSDGSVRADLGFLRTPRGQELPRLVLYGDQGQVQATLGLQSDGPRLEFRDGDQRPRCAMRMLPKGHVHLGFFDKQGWGQLEVGSFSDGVGMMLLGPSPDGRGGRDHGGLFMSPDGSAKLHFFTPGGIKNVGPGERVELGVRGDGTAVMHLNGDKPREGVRLEASLDGKATLDLQDRLPKADGP